jgi:hypothetical protein
MANDPDFLAFEEADFKGQRDFYLEITDGKCDIDKLVYYETDQDGKVTYSGPEA